MCASGPITISQMRVVAVHQEQKSSLDSLEAPVLERGHELVHWQAWRDPAPAELDDVGAVIVLGGLANPDQTEELPWLGRERAELARLVAEGTPVLGICLGAQLIAQALDGSAERMPAGEIGWVPIELDEAAGSDALLAGAPRKLDVQEWHNYACKPPAGAVVLARSPACVQAFRVGATTWGLQFHVEVTRPVLEEWCESAAAELEQLGLSPEAIVGRDDQRAEQLRLAVRIADRFARAVLAAAIPA
jgi:GMP synthase (glutamine-hydrolysing)